MDLQIIVASISCVMPIAAAFLSAWLTRDRRPGRPSDPEPPEAAATSAPEPAE